MFAIIIFNRFGGYEMREIKFRIRNTVNGSVDFVTLEYLMTNDQTNISQKGFREDLQVSQFTGLKDKNGAEIYEGDILSSGAAHYLVDICGYYSHASVGFGVNYSKDGDTSEFSIEPNPFGVEYVLSVIGNIHENPELIKPL